MPKVSVYLPDDLYELARRENLPLSTLTQRAITEALNQRSVQGWVAAVRARSIRRTGAALSTSQALDEAREEFGS